MSGQAKFGPVDGPGILPVRQWAGAPAWVFSAVGAVIMTDEVRYSQNAARTLGIEPNRVLSGAEWLKQIHPDDRRSVMACRHAVRPDNPSFSTTFRYMPQDGDREVWLEQIGIAEFDSAGQLAITVGADSLPEGTRPDWLYTKSIARRIAEFSPLRNDGPNVTQFRAEPRQDTRRNKPPPR